MRNYDNCLNNFLNDLKDEKRLSAEETTRLILIYQKTNDKKILDEIIIGNIWFIISRAKRYTNRYLSASDFIYSGILGMIRAAKKFDPSRKIKFITYACYWIEMYMRREVIFNSSIVKMTPRMWGMASALAKMKDSGATEEEIIKKLKIGRNTFKKLRRHHNDISLNSFLTNDPDADELEKMILVNYQTPAQICEESDESSYMILLLNKLKRREREVIERKFGLRDIDKENTMAISRKEEISAERVRQILKNGLKKLRKSFPARESYFK
ncbi:MAG TPA: hypothetical protein DD381_04070 [Lentisphaeria bacterium]|nr:MAG: hypothetical protein A2X47_06560 [Lentisphaerae bacterium GWF2_38_69]HBM15507.1 hypothetical protein [Lentisphaeria bacterium]